MKNQNIIKKTFQKLKSKYHITSLCHEYCMKNQNIKRLKSKNHITYMCHRLKMPLLATFVPFPSAMVTKPPLPSTNFCFPTFYPIT